eukprot:GILI01002522.1.p1 GENE.GILI01002522.1~~GILI01002522.1.p1  ORF type:complete len:443 (-),score=158.76 GILI01002522.1:456-1703(-)
MTTFVQLSEEDPCMDLVIRLSDEQKTEDPLAFQRRFNELLSQGQFVQVAKNLLALKQVIFKGSDKEIESAFSIVMHLFIRLGEDSAVDQLARDLTTAIGACTADAPHKFKMLGALFNVVSKRQGALDVFTAIINLAASSGSVEVLVPHLDSVEQWAVEWSLSIDQTRALYLLLANTLKTLNHNDLAFRFSVRFLSTFERSSPAELQTVLEQARTAVVTAIRVSDIAQCDLLLDMAAVKQMEKSGDQRLLQLLKIFAGERLEAFNAFNTANKGFVEGLGLKVEECVEKMRLLSLCSLACEHTSIPYSSIAQTLQVPEDQVEEWVVLAVTNGLLEAKMDQLRSLVIVERSSQRIFGESQWRQIGSRLKQWKTDANALLQVIRTARASHMSGEGASSQPRAISSSSSSSSTQRGRGGR